MKNDIVIAGVGGQGILTIAAIVGKAAVDLALNVKQSEVHGMAQRGGAVVAHLRISSERIYSDLIPSAGADVILAVEPLEALRHTESLAPGGVVLANSGPVENIDDYPDIDGILARIAAFPKHAVIDAAAVAKEAGNPRTMNVVMLGALSLHLDLPEKALTDTIRAAFARKGDKIVDVNLRAFAAGKAAAGA